MTAKPPSHPSAPLRGRNEQQIITEFLSGTRFAVAGASTNVQKYGNRVVHAYQQANRKVVPINPRVGADELIRGLPVVQTIGEIPDLPSIHGLSIITPPPITETLIDEIMALRDEDPTVIPRIWMQPGAESDRAIAAARANGIDVIAGGPCILVVLGYQADPA